MYLFALFYNEAGSQIALNAGTLKVRHTLITLQFASSPVTQDVLDAEWRKRTFLPNDLPTSPPPSSAQKVHAKISKNVLQPELATLARTSTPRTSTPSQNLFPLPGAISSTSKPGFLQLRPITPQIVTPQLKLQPLPLSDMDIDVEVDIDNSGMAGKRGLLITIREKRRTEGLVKVVEGVMRL